MASMPERNLERIPAVGALPYPPDLDGLHIPAGRLDLGLQALELGACE
jgi:hypothetical protein